MIKIAYVEQWDPIIHGISEHGFKPYGHYINTISPISLDTFYSLHPSSFKIMRNNKYITLEIIKHYTLHEYTLSILLTNKIRLFQIIWKKSYYKKLNHRKKLQSLIYRELFGKFPIIKYKPLL